MYTTNTCTRLPQVERESNQVKLCKKFPGHVIPEYWRGGNINISGKDFRLGHMVIELLDTIVISKLIELFSYTVLIVFEVLKSW